MLTILRTLIGLGLAALAAAANAQITFYDAPRFGGRPFTANQAVPNFADVGYNDRAASAIIRGGTWQLCTDAYFRGRCESLGPGEYADLGIVGVAYAISSARELTGWPGADAGAACRPVRRHRLLRPDLRRQRNRRQPGRERLQRPRAVDDRPRRHVGALRRR